jgi:hypothetical protein
MQWRLEKPARQVRNKKYRNDDAQLIGIPRPQQTLEKCNNLTPYSLTDLGNLGGLTSKV